MPDLARQLRATGELRDVLTDADVGHRLWVGNSAELHRLATTGDRTAQDYAVFVLDTWSRTLLREPGSGGSNDGRHPASD